MKKVYTVVVCLLLCFSAAFSQSVDLDRYNFNASFIDLPKMVIDTSFKTYFVEFDASSALTKDLEELHPAEMVNIEGWKKLSGNGHVKISTRLEDILVENVEVKERIEILKDKKGKEVGRKSYFYTQLSFSFAAESKVLDYRGKHITTIKLADRNSKQIHNGKEFPSFIEASLHYKYRGMDFVKEISRRAVQNAMNQLSSTMSYSYGYTLRTATDFLWILDSKRHPEYEGHKKAWLAFKQAMFQMNAEETLEEIRKSLAPVIHYYESIKKKYTTNSKGDRKIRYASYFNLAKIYYYLDDPDASMRWAGELTMNEYDEKDGKRLEAAATELKTLLKLNKFTGRHFPLEIEKYAAPGMVSAQD